MFKEGCYNRIGYMERKGTQSNRGLWIGLTAILLVSAAAIALWLWLRPPAMLDLARYCSVLREPDGLVAVLDTDAILKDLHLPEPTRPYPDVDAILACRTDVHETDDPEIVLVSVAIDTETLHAHGIVLKETAWEQPVRQVFESGALTGESPLPTATPLPPGQVLSSLLDGEGCGCNLRAVCEAVQRERDALLKETFGDMPYRFEKTQVSFSTDTGRNCYQATYRAWATPEQGPEGDPICFRIQVFDLMTAANSSEIAYRSVRLTMHKTEKDAQKTPYANVTVLSGGGVPVSGREAFDQNGFVLFPGQPTSYRMANGVYWSPTYDLLDEDTIWKLTAVDGHSLANLLRYARKEIYARYYAAFDPKSEREFSEHYSRYGWYEVLTPDRTADMTETERANIRLIREIQSLVEK